MNNIQYKPSNHEKISFAKRRVSGDNGTLSQNLTAVTPNCQNWLFLRPHTAIIGTGAGVNLPFTNLAKTSNLSKCYCLMVWLILQNKPIGEYAKRLLLRPRVRPHHPIGAFTQNLTGAFAMNAISNTIQKLAIFSPIESLVIGFILGLPMACLVIAVLAVMGV